MRSPDGGDVLGLETFCSGFWAGSSTTSFFGGGGGDDSLAGAALAPAAEG